MKLKLCTRKGDHSARGRRINLHGRINEGVEVIVHSRDVPCKLLWMDSDTGHTARGVENEHLPLCVLPPNLDAEVQVAFGTGKEFSSFAEAGVEGVQKIVDRQTEPKVLQRGKIELVAPL